MISYYYLYFYEEKKWEELWKLYVRKIYEFYQKRSRFSHEKQKRFISREAQQKKKKGEHGCDKSRDSFPVFVFVGDTCRMLFACWTKAIFLACQSDIKRLFSLLFFERDLIGWIKSHLAENIKKLKRLFLKENWHQELDWLWCFVLHSASRGLEVHFRITKRYASLHVSTIAFSINLAR